MDEMYYTVGDGFLLVDTLMTKVARIRDEQVLEGREQIIGRWFESLRWQHQHKEHEVEQKAQPVEVEQPRVEVEDLDDGTPDEKWEPDEAFLKKHNEANEEERQHGVKRKRPLTADSPDADEAYLKKVERRKKREINSKDGPRGARGQRTPRRRRVSVQARTKKMSTEERPKEKQRSLKGLSARLKTRSLTEGI